MIQYDGPVDVYFLLAALADITAVIVHCFIGHRIVMTPLTHDRLFSNARVR